MKRVVKLGELFRVGSSKRVLKSQWQSEGVPFYRGREVTRLAAEGFVENELFISASLYEELSGQYGVPDAEDIMITAIGTIGNSYVVRKEDRFYFKDASVLWLKKTADVSSEFINYWLKSDQFFGQLDRGNGATVDTLTIQKLQSLGIELPSLASQRRIVAILDEAFEGIATAKDNAAKNLKSARDLFALQRDACFAEGWQSWPTKPLGDLAEVESGGTPLVSTKEFWGGDVAWYSSGELNDIETSEPQRFITAAGLAGSNAKLFPKGALLVGMYDTAALKMSILDRAAAFNQAIAGVKPNPSLEMEFLFHAINFQKPTLLSLRRGVRQKNLSLGKIKEIVVPVPNVQIQRNIVERLRAAQDLSDRLQTVYRRKLDAFDELKKSLLHQAFTGALTAKTTDKQLATAA